ncbi:MAG: prepilin-type N-terminal cleavage/methylation domain-containing protein [Patescibacteria group bacterium]
MKNGFDKITAGGFTLIEVILPIALFALFFGMAFFIVR